MRISIKWGLTLGLALLLWTAAAHLLGAYTVHIEYAGAVDLVATLIPVAVLILALAERRRVKNHSLSLGDGVLTGLAVAAISAPITVAGLWYYHHQVNPEWLSLLVDYERQKLQAAGAPADQIAARIAQLQLSGEDRQQIIGGLIGTFAMALFLSITITTVIMVVDRMRRKSR